MPSTNNRQLKTEKAFTLIELLVVVAIVGILAGLAVVNMSGATEAARIAKLKVYSNSIRSSLMGNRVSEWRFDENSGTSTADTVGSGTGSLANFTGNYGWRPASECISGTCLSFDGVDDYVSVPDSQDLTNAFDYDFSVEVWAKVKAYPATNVADIIWKYWPGFIVRMGTTGYVNLYLYDGTAYQTYNSNFSFPLDQWVHFAAVRDYTSLNNVRWYINGRLNNTVSNTAGVGLLNSAGHPLYLGRAMNFLYFNGLLDEVRVYNAALTASAIREDYLAGVEKLLVNNQITRQEYEKRLADLNSTYAVSE